MKISILTNLHPPHARGGYELGCAEIGRRLWLQGHQVEVLTSKAPGRLHRCDPLLDAPPVHAIFEPVFEFDMHPAVMATQDWPKRCSRAFGGIVPGNVSALLAHWHQHPPGVVWAFNLVGLGPLGILEVLAYSGRRCVIHHMDSLDECVARYSALTTRFQRAKRQISAISCSHRTRARNEVLGHYRDHAVIPNGVVFDPSTARGFTEQAAEDLHRFVCFGQISSGKGILELLEAVAALVPLVPGRRFEISLIGSCAEPGLLEKVHEHIARLGLEEIARLLGPQPKQDLLAGLPQFDTAVMLLNPQEAFSYAVLEAAEAGLPVIFPCSAGAAEYLPADCPLLLRDRLDTAATAAIMARCILDPAWAREEGRRQRAAFQRTCDLDSRVLPACQEVLEAATPSLKIAGLEGTLLAGGQMAADSSEWMPPVPLGDLAHPRPIHEPSSDIGEASKAPRDDGR